MQIDQHMTEAAASAAGAVAASGASGRLHDLASLLSSSPLVIGFMGAAWLYMFAPAGKPIPKDATPEDRARRIAERKEQGKETGIRFALGGFFSWASGQFFIDLLDTLAPWLHASKHPILFYFLLGSVGWYVGRGLWLWLDKRKNKDIGQQIHDAAGIVQDVKAKV